MTLVGERYAIDEAAQNVLFRDARSATEFTGEPVTDADLAAVYDLARYAPTSLNQQPLRIVAVRGAALDRLLPHLNGRNRTRAEKAPLVVLLAADREFHEKLPEVFPHAAGLREVLAPQAAERARQARFNATLQIGFLIVAIRAAGLAAGPMIGFDAPAVNREFFPDGTREALLVCMIGHPRPRTHPRLPRLGYADVVSEVC